MVIRSKSVKFDNGRMLNCQKIIFHSDDYVALLTHNDIYEVYNRNGEKISPENCTYITRGIQNQLIIGFDKFYQVYFFKNEILHPLYFTISSEDSTPLQCVLIIVIGQRKHQFRYLLVVKTDKGERKGIGNEHGGNLLIAPRYTRIEVSEAGYIGEKTDENGKLYDLIHFDGHLILENYSSLQCQDGMIVANKQIKESTNSKDDFSRKVEAFHYNGEKILPVAFSSIRVDNGFLIGTNRINQKYGKKLYLYYFDGTPLFTEGCVFYEFVKNTSYLILHVLEDNAEKKNVGVMDTTTREKFISIQHHEITFERGCFIVWDLFTNNTLKIVEVVNFEKKKIIADSHGYDTVHFLEKYLVAEKDGKIVVVDYSGKILAQSFKEAE